MQVDRRCTQQRRSQTPAGGMRKWCIARKRARKREVAKGNTGGREQDETRRRESDLVS